MTLQIFQAQFPQVSPSAFVQETAQIIGDVKIGDQSSVWFNCVVRGDINFICIGEETNIQDLCCLHVTHKHSLVVGNRVTVGHGAILHGCEVGDDCLIGMGAIVLDGVQVGEGSLIAAGSLLTPGTKIAPGSLVRGVPATAIRPRSKEELEMIVQTAQNYVLYARQYQQQEKGE